MYITNYDIYKDYQKNEKKNNVLHKKFAFECQISND